MAQRARVVVRPPAPLVPVGRDAVPLLARHFASFAANAHSRIGKKSGRHRVAQWGIVNLPIVNRQSILSTLHVSALLSMILTFGSSDIAMRSFVTSPVTSPVGPKCHGSAT